MAKSELRELILQKKPLLKKEIPFITSFRGIDLYTLEIEICQKRKIGEDYELIFDSIRFEPQEIISHFPYLDISLDDLIYATRLLEDDFYNGPNYIRVIPFIRLIPNIHQKEKIYSPFIRVLEYTSSQLLASEDPNNENIIENVKEELEEEYHVLKEDNQYILDSNTGDKIFRFPALRLEDDGFNDEFIYSKVYESQYEKININKNDFFLFFDTETTGLPKDWDASLADLGNWPRLVQLAFIFFDSNHKKISEGNFIIKPTNFNIPQESTDIHRISQIQALTTGIEVQKALNLFERFANEATIIVGHNIDFDIKIVAAEYLRLNSKNPFDQKATFCTMKDTTEYCAIGNSFNYKWPKLSELYYKLFQENIKDVHNAEIDIQATAECFWELKKRRVIN